MPTSSARMRSSFSLFRVELEIRPEPTDEERDALEAAVAGAGLEAPRPAAYDSPWRAAALGEGAERDVRDP